MGFNDYNKIWNTWISDGIYNTSSVLSSTPAYASDLYWNSTTILGRDYTAETSIKEEPEVTIFSDRIPKELSHECRVTCNKESDLAQDRILLNLSKIKSILMMKCTPVRLERIECTMTPIVKKNIIAAWRKIHMYGKCTPFVARFDEYGRRLSDEIKIETLKGMTIKIVDPNKYGEYYLEFKGITPDHVFRYKEDSSVFDEDVPF